MGLLENIKNLPQDLADAIRRVKESGEADVTVYKTVVAGLKIVIKIGESDEDLDLEDKTSEELNDLLVELQRRLEIARAMATRPQLILLDEPAAGMNEEESAALTGFIKSIRDQYGITIVVIDHHMDVIMTLCNQIAVLNFGQLLAVGNPEEIQSNPDVITAYLGVDE